MSRTDDEIERVATQLDKLLDELGASAAALNAILTRPVPPPQGPDDERLVAP